MKRNEALWTLDGITPHAMTAITIDDHLPMVDENGLVPLMPYLDHLADALSHSPIGSGLRLSLTVNPLCSALPADDVILIGLMLAELVNNAVKRSVGAPQGTIAISFEMTGPHWRLAVSDDGRDDIDHTEREVRTDASVVKAIARKLDASIACSHTILQGTTIIVARGSTTEALAAKQS